MGNLTSQLTRTCIICGIEKPLSAFLQLSGKDGTSYGNICAKCRSLGKTSKPVTPATEDERGTTPSGIGIRGKEKIYADTKREQKIHTLKELYKKEEIKKQEVIEDKKERISLKEMSEKKHREFYINPKKDVPSTDKKQTQQIITNQQDQKKRNIMSVAEQHQTILEGKEKQHVDNIKTIAKEETKKTTTDFNNLFHGIETGRSEMQSAEVKKFFKWLGSSAPIVRMVEQGLKTKKEKELVTEGNKPLEPTRRR